MKRPLFVSTLLLTSCSLLVWLTNAKPCERAESFCEEEVLVKCTEGLEERIPCGSKGACIAAESRCEECENGIADDGEICFSAPQLIKETQFPPQDFVIVDLDDNDTQDVVIACWDESITTPGVSNDSIEVVRQLGSGDFEPDDSTIDFGQDNPAAIQSIDLNEDGAPDLIFTNNAGSSINTVENLGNGEFNDVDGHNSGPALPVGFLLSDLDADEDVDLLIANQGSNQFAILTSPSTNPDLDFRDKGAGGQEGVVVTISPEIGAGRFLASSLDIDGDALPDFVFAVRSPQFSGLQFITMESVTADLFSFALHAELNLANPDDLLVVNLDDDADDEIVLAHSDGKIVLINKEGAAFIPSELLPDLDVPVPSIAAEDLDADGDLDLILALPASQEVQIFANDGGVFALAKTITLAGSAPSKIKLADVNGDGELDIVVASQLPNNVQVLFSAE